MEEQVVEISSRFSVYGLQLVSSMNSIFRVATFLSLAFVLLESCAPLKPLEFKSVSDLKIEKLTSSPDLSLNLNLHNPNSFGCTLRDFEFNFLLSETQLASIDLKNNRLPANSDFTLPVSTVTSYDELIKFLPSGISSFNSGKEIPVTLTGKLTLKKFLFRKTFPFEFHSSINTKEIQLH